MTIILPATWRGLTYDKE